jgi:hypothetical protein
MNWSRSGCTRSSTGHTHTRPHAHAHMTYTRTHASVHTQTHAHTPGHTPARMRVRERLARGGQTDRPNGEGGSLCVLRSPLSSLGLVRAVAGQAGIGKAWKAGKHTGQADRQTGIAQISRRIGVPDVQGRLSVALGIRLGEVSMTPSATDFLP